MVAPENKKPEREPFEMETSWMQLSFFYARNLS